MGEVGVSRKSLVLVGVLAAVYVSFWIWWGGSGEPLTQQQADDYLARIEAIGRKAGWPKSEAFQAFRELATQDDGNEYYMINLMKYREKALYPPGYGYDDDVKAAADRYAAAVFPALLKRGSLPILLAARQGNFLGFEGADEWDEVGIVRYRSRRDMFEFAIDLGSQGLGVHKSASIEKTHVFPAEPIIDFVFVRGAVAVLLVLIGLAVHFLLRTRTRSNE